jgi:hypothetical protein
MARLKRGSRILNKAEQRLASIQAIDPNLILGTNLSIETYTQEIKATYELLNAYNQTLSTIDALYSRLQAAERRLANHSEKMLLGVAHVFGKDSMEYLMAGGTPKTKQPRSSLDSSIPPTESLPSLPIIR